MGGSLKRWRNAQWLLLIAAALFMRALVPQGMMLQQSGTGGIEIAPCPTDQTWSVLLSVSEADHGAGEAGHEASHSSHGEDQSGHGDDTANGACIFAGHSGAGTLGEGQSAPLPQVAAAAVDAIRERTLSPASPRMVPPARAPPITV